MTICLVPAVNVSPVGFESDIPISPGDPVLTVKPQVAQSVPVTVADGFRRTVGSNETLNEKAFSVPSLAIVTGTVTGLFGATFWLFILMSRGELPA